MSSYPLPHYIHTVQGYKKKGAYIATQGPLQNTVEDFWRMMWEYQCGCIVMLCQLEEDGQVMYVQRDHCVSPQSEGCLGLPLQSKTGHCVN